VLDALVAVVHTLAGAAWFGAMFYSTFVLHPRAHAFFERDADFEAFIATISHGARWKVLGAMGLLAATGALLAFREWQDASTTWLVLICVKAVLLLGALLVFIRVSWYLWPARILASPDEVASIQKKFRWVAWIMLTIAGLSIALGVLAQGSRQP
jgi:uncharacterized membrane protein